jgi:adenylate kinase
MNIVIFGPPASGKGTQAKILAENLNLYHLSTGDMFRQHIKDNTEIGKQVLQIQNGEYASDEITIQMVKFEIEKNTTKGFIFDGFPRTLPQAKELDRMLDISKIIFLNISKETLIKRVLLRKVQENRSDDDIEKFHNRYKDYEKSRDELSKYYKNINFVNGSLLIKDVSNRIFNIAIS